MLWWTLDAQTGAPMRSSTDRRHIGPDAARRHQHVVEIFRSESIDEIAQRGTGLPGRLEPVVTGAACYGAG